MKQSSALRTAEKHYRRREYAQTISTLEPQIFLYRENARFYHVLGLSCLKTGDLGGARSYLMRATQIDRSSIAPRLALAACDLGRSDTDEALQMWLEILDEDPANRYAQKGLDLLRAGLKQDDGTPVDVLSVMHRLYPDIVSRRIRAATVRRSIVLLAVLAGIAASAVYGPRLLRELRESGLERDGSELTELPRRTDLVRTAGAASEPDAAPALFVLSDSELRGVFDDLRRYFLAERDNLAAREINRILLSNAQQALKDQAFMLRGFLQAPSFADFTDSFDLDDVRRQPELYEGTYVRWSGRSSNLQATDERVTFDFLVGYEDLVTVDAIVPVEFTRAIRVDPQFAIELIGRINLDPETPEGFRLQGSAIRLIQVRGQ